MMFDFVGALALFCTVAFAVYRKIDKVEQVVLDLNVKLSQRLTRVETLIEERTR